MKYSESELKVINQIAQDIRDGKMIDESPDSWIWKALRGSNIYNWAAIRAAIFESSISKDFYRMQSNDSVAFWFTQSCRTPDERLIAEVFRQHGMTW
jgi:hypothetical protein